MTGWKERWLQAGDKSLVFYRSLKEKQPSSLLKLGPESTMTVMNADKFPPFTVCIETMPGAGTYVFVAVRASYVCERRVVVVVVVVVVVFLLLIVAFKAVLLCNDDDHDNNLRKKESKKVFINSY